LDTITSLNLRITDDAAVLTSDQLQGNSVLRSMHLLLHWA